MKSPQPFQKIASRRGAYRLDRLGLFRERGIRGIGVDAIADAALTNKMTLYRHFGSKDELVCETLRRASEKAGTIWRDLEAAYPGNPRAQLDAWVEMRAQCLNGEPAGCDRQCRHRAEGRGPSRPRNDRAAQGRTA